MSDLISRRALCKYALNQKGKSVTPNDIMRFPSAEPKIKCVAQIRIDQDDMEDLVNKKVKKIVEKMSETKTGRWILTSMLPDDCRYKCSICKRHHREKYDYCPSCGAKMVDCGKCKHWESDTGFCYAIADSDTHECNFEQI